jgi:hypothetical protein
VPVALVRPHSVNGAADVVLPLSTVGDFHSNPNYAKDFTKRLVRMHATSPSFPPSRDHNRSLMLSITSPHASPKSAASSPKSAASSPLHSRPLAERNRRSSPAARRLQL